jgi:Tetratricopeptide repeat
LAEREPSTYLPYLAATLNNLVLLDESQNRVEEARAHYQEDLRVYRELFQNNSEKYAGDVARVEVSLVDLGKKIPPDRPER